MMEPQELARMQALETAVARLQEMLMATQPMVNANEGLTLSTIIRDANGNTGSLGDVFALGGNAATPQQVLCLKHEIPVMDGLLKVGTMGMVVLDAPFAGVAVPRYL